MRSSSKNSGAWSVASGHSALLLACALRLGVGCAGDGQDGIATFAEARSVEARITKGGGTESANPEVKKPAAKDLCVKEKRYENKKCDIDCLHFDKECLPKKDSDKTTLKGYNEVCKSGKYSGDGYCDEYYTGDAKAPGVCSKSDPDCKKQANPKIEKPGMEKTKTEEKSKPTEEAKPPGESKPPEGSSTSSQAQLPADLSALGPMSGLASKIPIEELMQPRLEVKGFLEESGESEGVLEEIIADLRLERPQPAQPLAERLPVLTWEHEELTFALSPGQAKTVFLEVSVDRPATGLVWQVAPSIQGLVSVEGAAVLSPGQTSRVSVRSMVPTGTPPARISGTAWAGKGGLQLPSMLLVNLHVLSGSGEADRSSECLPSATSEWQEDGSSAWPAWSGKKPTIDEMLAVAPSHSGGNALKLSAHFPTAQAWTPDKGAEGSLIIVLLSAEVSGERVLDIHASPCVRLGAAPSYQFLPEPPAAPLGSWGVPIRVEGGGESRVKVSYSVDGAHRLEETLFISTSPGQAVAAGTIDDFFKNAFAPLPRQIMRRATTRQKTGEARSPTRGVPIQECPPLPENPMSRFALGEIQRSDMERLERGQIRSQTGDHEYSLAGRLVYRTFSRACFPVPGVRVELQDTNFPGRWVICSDVTDSRGSFECAGRASSLPFAGLPDIRVQAFPENALIQTHVPAVKSGFLDCGPDLFCVKSTPYVWTFNEEKDRSPGPVQVGDLVAGPAQIDDVLLLPGLAIALNLDSSQARAITTSVLNIHTVATITAMKLAREAASKGIGSHKVFFPSLADNKSIGTHGTPLGVGIGTSHAGNWSVIAHEVSHGITGYITDSQVLPKTLDIVRDCGRWPEFKDGQFIGSQFGFMWHTACFNFCDSRSTGALVMALQEGLATAMADFVFSDALGNPIPRELTGSPDVTPETLEMSSVSTPDDQDSDHPWRQTCMDAIGNAGELIPSDQIPKGLSEADAVRSSRPLRFKDGGENEGFVQALLYDLWDAERTVLDQTDQMCACYEGCDRYENNYTLLLPAKLKEYENCDRVEQGEPYPVSDDIPEDGIVKKNRCIRCLKYRPSDESCSRQRGSGRYVCDQTSFPFSDVLAALERSRPSDVFTFLRAFSEGKDCDSLNAIDRTARLNGIDIYTSHDIFPGLEGIGRFDGCRPRTPVWGLSPKSDPIPGGIKVLASSSTGAPEAIYLAWRDLSEFETGHRIEYWPKGDRSRKKVKELAGANENIFGPMHAEIAISELEQDREYAFWVRACNESGCSPPNRALLVKYCGNQLCADNKLLSEAELKGGEGCESSCAMIGQPRRLNWPSFGMYLALIAYPLLRRRGHAMRRRGR